MHQSGTGLQLWVYEWQVVGVDNTHELILQCQDSPQKSFGRFHNCLPLGCTSHQGSTSTPNYKGWKQRDTLGFSYDSALTGRLKLKGFCIINAI